MENQQGLTPLTKSPKHCGKLKENERKAVKGRGLMEKLKMLWYVSLDVKNIILITNFP